MEQKVCVKCKVPKDLGDFNKKKNAKDGYNAYCKICNKEYLKEHYEKNKQYYIDKARNYCQKTRDWANGIKEISGCVRCGESDIACLDFHHTGDEKKDFTISKVIGLGYSIDSIKKEIDKCIILCANCHRKLHYHKIK